MAVRAAKMAARLPALGDRVRELAAERVAAEASKAAADALRGCPLPPLPRWWQAREADKGADAGADPGAAAGGARGGVGAAHRGGVLQAGARGAPRAGGEEGGAGDGREQGGALKGEWAKERADRRTPEELARDVEEAGALHERLRTETPFVTHH